MSVHLFQSTLPVWGGTFLFCQDSIPVAISIHPPRVGRDQYTTCAASEGAISIHPPRVGRDGSDYGPVWHIFDFNPPSPCGEGPPGPTPRTEPAADFNPPSPCGEGPAVAVLLSRGLDFNPPSPCGEGPD